MSETCRSEGISQNASPIIYNSLQFKQTLLNQLKNLQNQQFACDIQIKAGSKSISAHKVILSSVSEYMKNIFNDAKSRNVNLKKLDLNINETALEDIVNYCYSGKIHINETNAKSLKTAATLFQIEEIIKECDDYIKNNCSSSLPGTVDSESDEFTADQKKFIEKAIDSFMDVYESLEFKSSNVKVVMEIIKSDDLRVPEEKYVFDAVRSWILFDLDNRKNSVELLDHIRFPLIDYEYLNKDVIEFGSTVTEFFRKFLKALQLISSEQKNGETYPPDTIPRKSTLKMFGVASWQTLSSNEIQLYNSWENSWSTYSRMNFNKINYGVTIDDVKLYIAGGYSNKSVLNTIEAYNLQNGTMTELPPMRTNRFDLGVIILKEGSSKMIFAIGGYDGWDSKSVVEKFDFNTKRWSYASPMKSPRHSFGIASLNGKIYVAGGRDMREFLNKVEMYDPKLNRWRTKAPMKTARSCCTLVENGGFLYAIGGFKKTSMIEPLDSIEKYDPETNSWSNLTEMPYTKGAVGAGFLGNTLISVGGTSQYQSLPLDEVDLYDLNKKEWKSGKPLKEPSHGVVVFPVPWKLIDFKSPKASKTDH